MNKKEPFIRKKKALGQHFLGEKNIANNIVNSLKNIYNTYFNVLEVGPGMGALTDFLIQKKKIAIHLIDIDKEVIDFLLHKYPTLQKRIIHADFLSFNLSDYFSCQFAVIGNFPYNISSQIIFKIIENRRFIPEIVGMFQKEVAVRIGANPGGKNYGVISVLTQAYYDIEYLFDVTPEAFDPQPKVNSGVIRLLRKRISLNCDEKLFKDIVKTGFSQRRKTLRNALKSFNPNDKIPNAILDLRAERLNVEDFINIVFVLKNQ